VGLLQRAAYCSSKGGVNLLTKVLAIEWAQYNINVNAVAPTFIETPFTKPMFEKEGFREYVLENIPLGRVGEPTDVVGAVIYLASSVSQFSPITTCLSTELSRKTWMPHIKRWLLIGPGKLKHLNGRVSSASGHSERFFFPAE